MDVLEGMGVQLVVFVGSWWDDEMCSHALFPALKWHATLAAGSEVPRIPTMVDTGMGVVDLGTQDLKWLCAARLGLDIGPQLAFRKDQLRNLLRNSQYNIAEKLCLLE
jgi:hypothetical protein